MLKRLKSLTIVFILFFVLFTKVAQASGEFETSCKAIYQVTEKGDVNVTQEITLENLKPDIYVSEYSLKLNTPEVRDIKAWDGIGSLAVKTSSSAEFTDITLAFNEKVVGVGNSLFFILKYEIPKFVKQEGLVRRISLPGLSSSNLPKEYALELYVPDTYGSLAFSSPTPQKVEKQAKSTLYTFDKSEIANSGAILDFGDFQIFDFSLNYNLENPESFPVIKKISLPPDTKYQSVRYFELSPRAENVLKDEDGNWLASYKLAAKGNLKIKARGKVKLFSSPLNGIPEENQDLNKYLSEEIFWEINHPKIQEIAKNLKTPEEIYNYVVKKLDYNYEKVNLGGKRSGALGALEQPKNSLCTEFTDLYVTLARASGIPAREIEGFAYTNNPKQRPFNLTHDILHSWPEYYDSAGKVWKMVDPTWGKTTKTFDYFHNFDMSHFAFAIHGVDSQFPLPAGTFKSANDIEKNVSVEFGKDTEFDRQPKIEVSVEFNPTTILSRSVSGNIIVKNPGPSAIYNRQLEIFGSDQLNPYLDSTLLKNILPFASLNIPIRIDNPHYIFKKIRAEKINLKLNNQYFEEKLDLETYTPRPLLYFLIILISLASFFLLYKLVSKFRKKM